VRLFPLIIVIKLNVFLHKKLQGAYFQHSMVFINSFMRVFKRGYLTYKI